MESQEYIEKWIESSITTSEWLSNIEVDHWEIIEELGLSESEIQEIEQHQYGLFNKIVANSVNSQIDRYQEVVKKDVFTEQLRILELFLKSIKVEHFLIELLKPIVLIRENDYLNVLKEYQNVLGRRYSDFKVDFNIRQKGSYSNGYYFTASVIREYKSTIEKYLTRITPQQSEPKSAYKTVEFKPKLKPEAVQIVFHILKDYFSPEQQAEFKKVIETGNKASNKLLFKGSGNRLADTFKKLIEHDFIIGCQKQDLINWIISNFTFTQQNMVKAFIYDTVEKTISRNYYPCKSPLIEIKNGQIEKVERPRKRKQRKY